MEFIIPGPFTDACQLKLTLNATCEYEQLNHANKLYRNSLDEITALKVENTSLKAELNLIKDLDRLKTKKRHPLVPVNFTKIFKKFE